MNKKTLSALIVISGILTSSTIIGLAKAQTITVSPAQTQEQQAQGNIQYPIKELGNCQSKNDCKVFCDDPKNSDACLVFARKNNLMSADEVNAAKKFKDNGMVGPGGCKGRAACDQYCGNSTHLEECITFGQKNGIMSDQQSQDSQKVLAAIKNGLKPPACSGPQQCNTYCSSPEHMEECMKFSLAAGIVPDDQKVQMQKTLDAIKNGAKPPACQPNQPGQSQSGNGLPACDVYCNDPAHIEECMNFSLAAGQVPDNQKEQVQKTLTAIKQGIRPPACQPNQPNQSGQPSQPNQASQSGQELQVCDQYCADPGHIEECVKFSVAVGNMTDQQAQSAIKTGGKGPGGCVGKDTCDTFCNNPDNQETCFNFAKDNGMISQDQLQQMQAGQQKMKESFASIPPEVLDCLTSSVGADVVEKMKTGSVIGRQSGDSINQCFQKSGIQEVRPGQNQNGQDQQGQQGQPGQSGQNQNQQGQNQSNQQNQQIQPWKDMCKPDENGNPTALACVDGAGGFVASAKVGSDGKPVCPASSTAKCGNYQQQNQQGQPGQNQQGQTRGNFQTGQPSGIGGPNEGQGFNPGSGQNGNGPGLGPIQNQQFNQGQNSQTQPGQPGQFNQPNQPNQQGQPGGQMQPQQQQFQPQSQQPAGGNMSPQGGGTPPQQPRSSINPPSFLGLILDIFSPEYR